MKKILCLVLAAVLVLGLFACGGNSKEEKETGLPAVEGLHVGFGKADITPAMDTPLGGYGSTENRLSAGLLDNLFCSCLAFQDGTDVLLVYTFDAIRSNKNWTAEVRSRVSSATGVKAENILVTSTHSHSAPDLSSTLPAVTNAYWEVYMAGALKAAEAAIADMSPAKLLMGATQTESMNFIRHYEMNDGTYLGSNFGNPASGIKSYATELDPEMRLVQIVREAEDKQDILIMNFAVHPCFTGGSDKFDVSADFIAPTRSNIENAGMHFFFIQSAAGDVAAYSRINEHNTYLNFDNAAYGQKLAQYALDALPTLTEVEGSGIAITSQTYEYSINCESVDPDMLAKAREVVALWESTNRETANTLAYSYGLNSVYEASALISRSERTPGNETFELYTTRIGGIGFVHTPYEMFTDNAKYIKENSPFGENTVIATMTNHAWGYFPTQKAYDYGCYESFGATFAPGVGEFAAEKLVELLGQVKD